MEQPSKLYPELWIFTVGSKDYDISQNWNSPVIDKFHNLICYGRRCGTWHYVEMVKLNLLQVEEAV